jgi:hypothetical protein
MKYEITSYSFFRTAKGAEFVKDGKRYEISKEQLECLLRQYRLMGFRVIFDNDLFVSVSKVENAIEVFLEALRK